MLHKKDIKALLLEGFELICTTYETERELIKACTDDHEVSKVSYIGTYDDVNYEAKDGFEVFDGDMVYKVIRRNKEVYMMDNIYKVAYEIVSNIPYEGEAILYNDMSFELSTGSGSLLHDYKVNELVPIFRLNLSPAYWVDYFNEYGIDINLNGDDYETLMKDLAEGYAETISDRLDDYIEGTV